MATSLPPKLLEVKGGGDSLEVWKAFYGASGKVDLFSRPSFIGPVDSLCKRISIEIMFFITHKSRENNKNLSNDYIKVDLTHSIWRRDGQKRTMFPLAPNFLRLFSVCKGVVLFLLKMVSFGTYYKCISFF